MSAPRLYLPPCSISHPCRYYHENCVKVNISSYDALTAHACNQGAKLQPVIVDAVQFADSLWHAADAIGAFSLLNPDWEQVAKEGNIQPLSYEEWISGRPQELIGDNYYDQQNAAAGR